ncbi:MAG: ABC transporter permease subunit, partial [Desulfobacterales bacterium]
MQRLKVIIRKELADHFSSYRFAIIFALIAMVSLITAYMVGLNIRKELEGVAKPQFIFLMLFTSTGAIFSLVQFVAFFGPLVGLILGFDTINRERNEGTLSKLLSQPIYRDTVINGKFLAGVVMITVMMVSIVSVITGLGLIVLGIVPGVEELLRIFIYLIISIIYISFWLGIAILFSILFRSTATSALAALAVWIFFSFFVSIGANILANALTPETELASADDIFWRAKVVKAFTL